MYVAKGWFDLAVKENQEMHSRKWPLYSAVDGYGFDTFYIK